MLTRRFNNAQFSLRKCQHHIKLSNIYLYVLYFYFIYPHFNNISTSYPSEACGAVGHRELIFGGVGRTIFIKMLLFLYSLIISTKIFKILTFFHQVVILFGVKIKYLFLLFECFLLSIFLCKSEMLSLCILYIIISNIYLNFKN